MTILIEDLPYDEKDIEEIITQDNLKASKKLVDIANDLGKRFASENKKQKITTTQIRNAYGTMKKLEMEMINWDVRKLHQLQLLKPRLAYAAGRHKGTGVKDLKTVISKAIDCVDNQETFIRFCQFFEAIVAYHKGHGGE